MPKGSNFDDLSNKVSELENSSAKELSKAKGGFNAVNYEFDKRSIKLDEVQSTLLGLDNVDKNELDQLIFGMKFPEVPTHTAGIAAEQTSIKEDLDINLNDIGALQDIGNDLDEKAYDLENQSYDIDLDVGDEKKPESPGFMQYVKKFLTFVKEKISSIFAQDPQKPAIMDDVMRVAQSSNPNVVEDAQAHASSNSRDMQKKENLAESIKTDIEPPTNIGKEKRLQYVMDHLPDQAKIESKEAQSVVVDAIMKEAKFKDAPGVNRVLKEKYGEEYPICKSFRDAANKKLTLRPVDYDVSSYDTISSSNVYNAKKDPNQSRGNGGRS